MIAKLTGIVDSLGEDWAVIDVGGVGYLVYCPGRVLTRLVAGEAVSVLVETHVREDHIHLYGFLEAAERHWFRLLNTVQGVGSRVALAILGVLGPDELTRAIAAQDKKALGRASGVGPKLAARIVAELKDKVGPGFGAPTTAATGGGPAAGATAEAVSALVNLGYGAGESLGAVSKAATALGEAAPTAVLIRGALRELAPGA